MLSPRERIATRCAELARLLRKASSPDEVARVVAELERIGGVSA